MKDLLIRTLLIEPLKRPKEAYVSNCPHLFNILLSQDNYYICDTEIIKLEDTIAIIKNEESELLNLKGNRRIKGTIIAGTFFVVGIDEKGNIVSLSDEKLRKYYNRFWEIEKYTDKEVSKSFWDSFEKTIADMDT